MREDFDGPRLPTAVSMAALAMAGRALQPDGASRPSATVRARNDWQSVSPGPRRASSAGALLQRRHGCRGRAAAFPADGGSRLLLQQRKFHYLYISHDAAVGKHVRVMTCLPDQVQSDAFTAPIAIPAGPSRAPEGRSGLRAPPLRLSGRRQRLAVAAAAVRREYPLRRSHGARDCRTLPARSSAWPARTWPGPAMPADFDYFEYQERDYRHNPAPISLSLE